MKGKLSDFMLPAPVGGGFSMEGYWVWCGSVIKGEDGNYHMFASRWSKSLPMHPGWVVASEVVRAVSTTPEGPYEFQEVVLPARGAQYWDGRATHNPSIMKCGDTYVLYYMGSTHPFQDITESDFANDDYRAITARANKRVGIATAPSVFGPWTRYDKPILQTRPEEYDSFFHSNPAPCQDENGNITLLFKSRKYLAPPYEHRFIYSQMEIGAAKAAGFRGPYMQTGKTPLLLETGMEIEDPFIWKDEDGYNMMAKDMNGAICGERHGGIYGSSEDGIHWDIKKNFLFYSRKILWDDGIVREMGNLDRPFLLFENGKPTHLFFATSENGFTQSEHTWNMVIPLRM